MLKPAAHIISTAFTRPATKTHVSVSEHVTQSLHAALRSVSLSLSDLDGLITVPALAEPKFMEAHALATKLKLYPHPRFYAKTMDVGGAGPVSCLLDAKRIVTEKEHNLVAVVAADVITSLPVDVFLQRADSGFSDSDLKSPFIPNAYDRIAQWAIDQGSVTRNQLAMATVLLSQQASRHPDALTRTPHTLESILAAKQIAPVTSLYECARRADGAAVVLVASSNFINRHGHLQQHRNSPRIIGGGETSGPLYPPSSFVDGLYTCEEAVAQAFKEAKLSYKEIQFYGLYDCFPICFIKAIEAVKLAPKGKGGEWIEHMYHKSLNSTSKMLNPDEFPINTHGGLMCFGAPWETPAMYNIIEAVQQLNRTAVGRQVSNVKNALVYGNGGVFSASSVAILTNDDKRKN